MTDTQDLKDRVVLITGASRGIGYAAAKEAAKRGAHVVAVARTVGGLEDLDDEIQAAGGSCTIVPLDLTDGAGIDRLGGAIFERWKKLDAVIGNAGYLGVLTPVPHAELKDYAKIFAVNVEANFRLIRSLHDLVRQSDAGRFTFVTSGAAQSAKPYWGLYAATKGALNAMAKSYAGEMVNTSVRVNVFDPGRVRTAMRAKAVPGEAPETLPHPSEIAPRLIDTIMPGFTETGKIISASGGLTEL